MPVTSSTDNSVLVRVPVPQVLPNTSNGNKNPPNAADTSNGDNNSASDNTFKKVGHTIPHHIIIPYSPTPTKDKEVSKQLERCYEGLIQLAVKGKRKRRFRSKLKWKDTVITNPGLVNYEKQKAPEGGIINRGIYYEGGTFIPDMPEGINTTAVPEAEVKSKGKIDHKQILKHLQAIMKHVKIKYAAEENQEQEEELTPIRTIGGSGKYYQDRKHFYKKPHENVEIAGRTFRLSKQLYAEPAASKALREFGIEHILPADLVKVKGNRYIKTPRVKNPQRLSTSSPHPSQAQLEKFALGTWLVHAMDRHPGNYIEDPDNNNNKVHAIDFGESWHPEMGYGVKDGFGTREMHPVFDSLLQHFAYPSPSNVKVPHTLIHEALDKSHIFYKHLDFASQALTPEHKIEAKNILDRKFEILKDLAANTSKQHTIMHLPMWTGHEEQHV